MHEPDGQEAETGPGAKELFGLLWPYLLATAFVAVGLTVALMRLAPIAAPLREQKPAVATFDVVRYINAQRAVASAFLKQGADQVNAIATLSDLPLRTKEAIAAAAGPNTLVVEKSLIIQGATKDITSEVLKRLGLPADVPTSNAIKYSLEAAPTMFMKPPPAYKPRTLPGESSLSGSTSVLP
jgi:hypothetical protein